MATGDTSDMLARLRANLPRGWFPDATPILDGLLSGLADMWAWVFALIGYARLQLRIATATEGWLDAISTDLFGARLPRLAAEPDNAFRARIKREILREHGTRAAVASVLTDLTGQAPRIFEPANTGDTGGYNTGAMGYGVAGAYGSLALPFQAFVDAYRGNTAQGIPALSGYGDPEGGYGSRAGGVASGALAYGSISEISGAVTDADIYAAVASVIPAGTIAWVNISTGPT